MAGPRAERPHMPDYGVDTPSWVPLPWSWAAERLLANRNYWVVTVSAAGRPHVLPVWGCGTKTATASPSRADRGPARPAT